MARILTGAVLALVGYVLAVFFWGGELTLEQAWQSLVMVAMGALALWRGEGRTSVVVALMITSLLVLFSRVNPSEAATLGPVLNPVVVALWTALSVVFPFLFVHFALLFPIVNRWLEERTWPHWALYLPFVGLMALDRLDSDFWGMLPILAYPVGFLVGLAILLRKYHYSLTLSEKNRLWVLLIGCLAGALPRLWAALGSLKLPDGVLTLAEAALPLFPAALLLVVMRGNFAEIGLAFRRVLVAVQVYGGLFNIFLIVFLAAAAVSADEGGTWDSLPALTGLAAAAAAAYPLVRWGGRLVASRFDPLLGLGVLSAPPRARSSQALRALDGFQPIQPNPYIVGNPVRSSKMFFGRREEFDFIRRRLETEREGCLIVLCGERRAGKTSILYQLQQGRLGEGYHPVFIDMQGMIVSDDRQFLAQVWRAIAASLEGGFELDAAEPPRDYPSFTAALGNLFEEFGSRRLLVLIDEYELIDDKVKQGKLSPEVHSYLNSLLEGLPRLSLVFTGSRPLDPQSPWEELLARSSYREISFLGREDARALIEKPLEGRAEFSPGAVNRLWRLARGHPFFTQLLCQTLVDVLNERRQRKVDEAVGDEVVHRVLENPPPQLLYQWSAYSPAERLALSSLATLLPSSDAFLAPQRCRRLISTLPDQASRLLQGARLRMIFERLRQRSVLDRDQTRYRFTLDLMRLWIRSERNVWNVLNEIGV